MNRTISSCLSLPTHAVTVAPYVMRGAPCECVFVAMHPTPAMMRLGGVWLALLRAPMQHAMTAVFQHVVHARAVVLPVARRVDARAAHLAAARATLEDAVLAAAIEAAVAHGITPALADVLADGS